ncbi:MAG: hypothetical protein ABH867_01520 [Patescibacteria group bacterium]|nr:DsbA family protein [Patescibacteria group bacterium]
MAESNKSPAKNIVFLLVVIASFFAGSVWSKRATVSQESQVENSQTQGSGQAAGSGETVDFSPEKSPKPNVKFFVMSYCPFGNQAEAGLKPVTDLLGTAVDWELRYVIQKTNNEQIKSICEAQLYSEEKCKQYVEQGYFQNTDACKQTLPKSADECLTQESAECMATEDGSYYCSLHGKKELNQNIREICAWNLAEDKSKWWSFVSSVNNNCSLEEVDQCWQAQADQTGIDRQKVQQCFSNDAVKLLEGEVALNEKFSVTSSPTVLINDKPYPPETAWKSSLKIGGKTLKVEEYRSPEGFKTAICAAFKKEPKECKETLSLQSSATGSCN